MRQPVPFGKYLLLDRVSVGGMAEVFKAKSYGVEGFEKIIAIKRILPSMCEDQAFIGMFIDEAKIAGQLTHANICQIFELGRVDSAHFIAMEYIWGRDLLQIQNRLRQRRERMPVEMACFLVAQVCEGLDYAHRKKDALGRPMSIIHRDCSPQNILVSFEGEVKIIDFGIAKAASRSSRTNAGVLKGKFGYMSPEQVRGLPLDRRSDIFALGTVLYESLTGERLFLGESDFSTLERVRNADVRSPRELNANIPPEVEAIVLQALAKDVDDRYQWCGEMRTDLHKYLMSRGEAFTASSLSSWMREVFAVEVQKEQRLMEQYRAMGRDGLIDGVPQAKASGDVAARLGEAGAPEGDPTTLGGPSIDEMLADAEQRFSHQRAEVLVGGETHGVSGELESEDTMLHIDPSNGTIDLSDSEIEMVSESESRGDTDPGREPVGPLFGDGADMSRAHRPGYATGSVPTLGIHPTSAMARRRHARLVRDIAIGIAIALAVMLAVFGGKRIFGGDEAKPTAARGALAVVTADGKQAEVFLNGELIGTTGEGKPLTLEGLAQAEYEVEVRRDGEEPCRKTVAINERVEVVSCAFAPPKPEYGVLYLDGVTAEHRIFLGDTEISSQAASEAIHLAPGVEQVIYVRVGADVIQELRVMVPAGEVQRRRVVSSGTAVKQDEPAPGGAPKKNEKSDEELSASEGDGEKGSKDEKEEKARPKVGYLTAKTSPWARVLIDDEDTGKMTPIPARAKLALRPGAHKVTFVLGDKRYSYRVDIEAGKTVHLEKNLGE